MTRKDLVQLLTQAKGKPVTVTINGVTYDDIQPRELLRTAPNEFWGTNVATGQRTLFRVEPDNYYTKHR